MPYLLGRSYLSLAEAWISHRPSLYQLISQLTYSSFSVQSEHCMRSPRHSTPARPSTCCDCGATYLLGHSRCRDPTPPSGTSDHELTHSQHNLSRATAKAVSALLQASAAVFPLPRLVGHVQETFIGLRQPGCSSVCSYGKHFCRSGVVLRGHVNLRTTTDREVFANPQVLFAVQCVLSLSRRYVVSNAPSTIGLTRLVVHTGHDGEVCRCPHCLAI